MQNQSSKYNTMERGTKYEVLLEKEVGYSDFIRIVANILNKTGYLSDMTMEIMTEEEKNNKEQLVRLVELVCKRSGFTINKEESNGEEMHFLRKYELIETEVV